MVWWAVSWSNHGPTARCAEACAMRSKLFVPGARPELFAKAMAGDADAVSFDLEDAVTEDCKDTARANVAAYVATARARDSGKLLIVRCNGLGTPQFEVDLRALAGAGLDLLNLPKLDTADELRAACADLSRAEKMLGIRSRCACW